MILIIFLIISLIIGLYFLIPFIQQCIKQKLNKNNLKEEFITYEQPYYNYQNTGRDPLMFYAKPIYRKPYRFPFKFYKSYPIQHLSNYELL